MKKSIKTIIRDVVTSNKLLFFAYSRHTETAVVYQNSELIPLFLDILKGATNIEDSTKVDSVRNIFRKLVPGTTGLYFTISAKDKKPVYLYISEMSLRNNDMKNLLKWAGFEVRRNSFDSELFEICGENVRTEWNDSANPDLYGSEEMALAAFISLVFYPEA